MDFLYIFWDGPMNATTVINILRVEGRLLSEMVDAQNCAQVVSYETRTPSDGVAWVATNVTTHEREPVARVREFILANNPNVTEALVERCWVRHNHDILLSEYKQLVRGRQTRETRTRLAEAADEPSSPVNVFAWRLVNDVYATGESSDSENDEPPETFDAYIPYGQRQRTPAQTHAQRQAETDKAWIAEQTLAEARYREAREARTEIGRSGCGVCLEDNELLVLVPCGHRHFCRGCLRSLAPRLCPLCRKRFTDYVKVWE